MLSLIYKRVLYLGKTKMDLKKLSDEELAIWTKWTNEILQMALITEGALPEEIRRYERELRQLRVEARRRFNGET